MKPTTITKESAVAIIHALDMDHIKLKELLDTCERLSVGDASHWRKSVERNRNARNEILNLGWQW